MGTTTEGEEEPRWKRPLPWLEVDELRGQAEFFIENPLPLWCMKIHVPTEYSTVRFFNGGKSAYRFTRCDNPIDFWMFYRCVRNKVPHGAMLRTIRVAGVGESKGNVTLRLASYVTARVADLRIGMRCRRPLNKWKLTRPGIELGEFIESLYIHPNMVKKFDELASTVEKANRVRVLQTVFARHFPKEWEPYKDKPMCSVKYILDIKMPTIPEITYMDDPVWIAEMRKKVLEHYSSGTITRFQASPQEWDKIAWYWRKYVPEVVALGKGKNV